MYQLDYILPQVAKLSRALQTKHLDLSLISSLVDATPLGDAILPSANWVLQLQDAREELKAATGIEVTHLDICSIQERVGKPFIRLIKDNISSWFRSSSKDVLSAFSIFDPKKMRRHPSSPLTSAQSGNRIVSSILAAKRWFIYATEGITHQ